MTKKPTDLKNALNKASEPVQPKEKVEQPPKIEKTSKYPLAAARVGKKTIAGHFDTAVSVQLKRLAVDEDVTVQQLLGEAINLLFEKYGKPPIA